MVLSCCVTIGKGSTVAYLSSSISSAGHKVGVFTSPHLHTARERIKINGDLISKTAMTKYGTQAYELLADKSWVVFFDLLLATAILYFGNKEVDYILLETGIGGRYDSTNFLDYCDCAIITSISLDHQSFLGETVEKIAWQKAGIIKKNSIVFTPASQKSSVIQVLQKQCDELNAILNIIPADRNQIDCDEVNISYGVQLENASTTAAALKFLRISRSGMKNFYWPCRMEEFRVANRQIVIDGCHNGDSVERFLRNLREKVFNKKIVVMFGAGQDKCLDAMLNIVFESADKVVMIQASHFKSLSEYELLSRVPANKQNLIYPFQVMVDKEQFLRDSKGTVQKRIETILKDDEFK